MQTMPPRLPLGDVTRLHVKAKIRWSGFTHYTTRDTTQFRDAGPLTRRHKCTVYGDRMIDETPL